MTTVELTPLRDEDSPALFDWINDRALVVQNAPYRSVPLGAHNEWFDAVRQRDDVRIFAIREEGRLVGSCQLRNIHAVHRSAELQIRIGVADARGRGIGTAAVRQLLRVAFCELALNRVYLHVFATNQPARRLYERVGFKVEGLERDAAYVEERWVDVVLMAILAAEFAVNH